MLCHVWNLIPLTLIVKRRSLAEPNDSAVTRLLLRADAIEALGYSRSDFLCNLLLLETWCFFNNTPEMLEWNIGDFLTRISVTCCLCESQFKILSCLPFERGSTPRFYAYIFFRGNVEFVVAFSAGAQFWGVCVSESSSNKLHGDQKDKPKPRVRTYKRLNWKKYNKKQ